ETSNPRTKELARLLAEIPHASSINEQAANLVWIAGSTQAPEEKIVVEIYQKLVRDFPVLRLFLVPRQKDRFGEVARMLEHSGMPFVRRGQLPSANTASLSVPISPSCIILVDSIGELSALWGLADLAFVGGSLDGKRGGQNMIEPAAYGAAVI